MNNTKNQTTKKDQKNQQKTRQKTGLKKTGRASILNSTHEQEHPETRLFR